MSGTGRETLNKVQEGSVALPVVRDGSVYPLRVPKGVKGPSWRSWTDRETLPEVWERYGTGRVTLY